MKANEAPEKVYIACDVITEEGRAFISEHPVSYLRSVEYTRTGAFIEKACDAYCKVCGHYAHKTPTYICRQACEYYDDFRAYMEGE